MSLNQYIFNWTEYWCVQSRERTWKMASSSCVTRRDLVQKRVYCNDRVWRGSQCERFNISCKHVLHLLTESVSVVSASSSADWCTQYLYMKPCTNNCILKFK